jgi:hypothetical protein
VSQHQYHDQVRQQLATAQDALRATEAERDSVYRERAQLLAWLAALHPAVITPAADVNEPDWQILYLTAGGRQMSWHISPSDAELFKRVPHVPADDPRAQWDGHTTAQKYDRIRQHTTVVNLLHGGQPVDPATRAGIAEARVAAVRALAAELADGCRWSANAPAIGEEILAALDGPADGSSCQH